MTEVEAIVKKQDTKKSRVCIKTADGFVLHVDFEVAILCGMLRKELQSGHEGSMNNPISLPPTIKKNFLRLAINHCRHHHVSGSAYEGNNFDDILYNMDANNLYQLANVARYLQMELLIDRTNAAVVKKIESLSCFGEFYSMFNRPDNVTEEEHLSWINLFRRYFTKSKKEDKGNENSKKFETASKPRHHEDKRPIDDLVAFIEGGDGDSKGVQTRKKKKKNRKKDTQKNDSSRAASSNQACILKKGAEGPDEISSQAAHFDLFSYLVDFFTKAYLRDWSSLGLTFDIFQDPNASEATSHGVQGSSISIMVADQLNLSNTRDKSVTVEDDIDYGHFGSMSGEEFDRVLEDFARKLILKEPVIYFDSSSQEESENHEFLSKEIDP